MHVLSARILSGFKSFHPRVHLIVALLAFEPVSQLASACIVWLFFNDIIKNNNIGGKKNIIVFFIFVSHVKGSACREWICLYFILALQPSFKNSEALKQKLKLPLCIIKKPRNTSERNSMRGRWRVTNLTARQWFQKCYFIKNVVILLELSNFMSYHKVFILK